jgi:predicted nucleotidyltransferase
MMSKEDRRILEIFSARVRGRFPDARIWAFGSRAKGNAVWDSDFDVCVVLPRCEPSVDGWIRDVAWETGFENERVMTTVVFEEEEFDRGPMSESTLVGNILREGIAA